MRSTRPALKDASSASKLKELMRQFVRMYEPHEAREDTVLFPAIGSIVSEGIQKFLFPEQRGVGRFLEIGLPNPELLAPFVGLVEITCGVLVLIGLATRLAAVPLLWVMTVALATTKYPILVQQGFWAAAHEARTDWSMFLGALFLLTVGAGSWSVDARLSQKP